LKYRIAIDPGEMTRAGRFGERNQSSLVESIGFHPSAGADVAGNAGVAVNNS
jgi:hypothetical protein